MHRINLTFADAEGTVSENIYGQFIEHLGDCINGGIYDGQNLLSDEKGIRLDVLEKVKKLSPPILRFPGGTVMHIYHWEDAIGPMSERKQKKNLIWGGVLSPAFGTAEFIEYCRRIGAEPMICVNMASGTPEEAGNWVDYCNGTGDTYYANLRRSHGYEEPFCVKYWCIGNECNAEPDIGIQDDVKIYIRDAREFIKFMKLNDPSIETVIVGCSDFDGWNKPVLDALGSMTNYLSFHFYTSENGMGPYGPFAGERHYLNMVKKLDELLDTYPEKPESFNKWYRFPPRQDRIRLMIDEWNLWQYKNDGIYGLHQIYNGRDMVWIASMLNHFISDPHIAGCNMAQLCNIIAPIVASKDGCFEQTIFAPCELYRKTMYGCRMETQISGQYTIDGGAAGEVEAVSASAVKHNGKICAAVVNRNLEEDTELTLPFDAACVICHAEPDAVNSPEHNAVEVVSIRFSRDEPIRLPVCSFVIACEI